MPLFLRIFFLHLSSKQEPFFSYGQWWHHIYIYVEKMLFTLLILGRRTSSSSGYPCKPAVSAWIWCSILTSHKGYPSFVTVNIPLLLVTSSNGNSWSGKTWGFHHAIVHLKIKMNQKLTLLEAKNIMLALVPKKGIREVSLGLEFFLADLQDSCVFPIGSCSRHKWGNLTAEDQIIPSVP